MNVPYEVFLEEWVLGQKKTWVLMDTMHHEERRHRYPTPDLRLEENP